MTKLIWTLLLTAILGESLHADAFIEMHYVYCGSILELGPVGYLNWNPATIVRPPEHGDVYLFTGDPFPDSLVYKSDYGYLDVDTFVVACARATQVTCETGIYIVNVSCINRVKENSYGLELRLYPNPAREFLRLECAVPIEK